MRRPRKTSRTLIHDESNYDWGTNSGHSTFTPFPTHLTPASRTTDGSLMPRTHRHHCLKDITNITTNLNKEFDNVHLPDNAQPHHETPTNVSSSAAQECSSTLNLKRKDSKSRQRRRCPLRDLSSEFYSHGNILSNENNVTLPVQYGFNSTVDVENSDLFETISSTSSNYVTAHLNNPYLNSSTGTDQSINNIAVAISEYLDEGDANYNCSSCGARIWANERSKHRTSSSSSTSSICCSQGKVQLPLFHAPPVYLQNLFFNRESMESSSFLQHIRAYNTMFSFTSMGGRIDKSFMSTPGPYMFALCGQNYHRIGSLLPVEGSRPLFGQLYIYDTDHELSNRLSFVSSTENSHGLDPLIVRNLMDMLNQYNPYVKSFRMASTRLLSNDSIEIKMRLLHKRESDGRIYNLPTSSEVAALIVGDFDSNYMERDIIIQSQTGQFQRISELHPSYLPLQYPLLFPYGEDGYREDICHHDLSLSTCSKNTKVTIREFLAFRVMSRDNEISTLLHARRLFQQFIVDGYTMIESQRLNYIRTHQKQLRVELYNGLSDAIFRGDTEGSTIGKRVILPSSFTGGARYMLQNYQDGMSICAWAGYPDLFLTFTCNPKWPEIERFIQGSSLKAVDRPDILSRIFKLKLQELMKFIRQTKFFGRVIADMYTVEFQKRGLPHAHILLFLATEHKVPTPEDIDNIICAEIPDQDSDPTLYDLVKNYMLHGPCGHANPRSPCMKDNKCSKYFPKKFLTSTTIDDDGYPIYRRRNDGRIIEKNGVHLDNRFVVPYNPKLLKLFQAHLNIERCNQSRSIKYLFKYISKGNDRVVATIYDCTNNSSNHTQIDEIKQYYDCRYISACEASWRIFAFDIHHRRPSVERLSFHLPGQNPVIFQDNDSIEEVLQKPRIQESMFTAWMEANKEYPFAKNYTYAEFPQYFVFNRRIKRWTPRKCGFSIGRLYFVSPTSGELYYQRILLNKVRGATCFDDIKTVRGKIHKTFQEACYDLGLLQDDDEFIEAINEASLWGSGHYLRLLFVNMLLCNSLARPDIVWNRTCHLLAEDLLYRQERDLQGSGLHISMSDKVNVALVEIEKLLRRNGKTLANYPSLPFPESNDVIHFENRLILEQLNFNKADLELQFNRLFSSMTTEQRNAFNLIMESTVQDEGKVFFLYGYGGTGKTFLWNALTSALRSKGEIVLTVASSGIASILLPGGTTAHSRFAIPILITEDSTCNIKQGSPLAELLHKTKLIIWDEAPMIHRYCFEALDRTLRDIMQVKDKNNAHKPFGGKSFVMGGDFRQILPVIPKGSRADIVHSSINSSYLWCHCQVLTLTQNMRLQSSSSMVGRNATKNFADWIINIGDGKIGEPHHGEVDIEIPSELLITKFDDPILAIVSSTYPSLVNNFSNPEYLKDRAILAPTFDIVQKVNSFMLSLVPGEEQDYYSSDTVCNSHEGHESGHNIYTPEFLNSINISGLPPHKLTLKVGVPIMLIRNIDQASGLCNGTRLIISQLGKHVIEGMIINGTNIGQKVFLPRMNMSPSDTRWPFKLQRRQFPVIISFAMTINKSQGQSLANVGLYLPKPVFSHGQLYVAISRVKKKDGLKILIHDSSNNALTKTKNVVYKEIFQNLT